MTIYDIIGQRSDHTITVLRQNVLLANLPLHVEHKCHNSCRQNRLKRKINRNVTTPKQRKAMIAVLVGQQEAVAVVTFNCDVFLNLYDFTDETT